MDANVPRGTCCFCLENGGSRFGTFLLKYISGISNLYGHCHETLKYHKITEL
jgi:hypothetical protein